MTPPNVFEDVTIQGTILPLYRLNEDFTCVHSSGDGVLWGGSHKGLRRGDYGTVVHTEPVRSVLDTPLGVFIVTDSGILRSIDGGETFQVEIAPINTENLVLGFCLGDVIAVNTDKLLVRNGGTWTPVQLAPMTYSGNIVEFQGNAIIPGHINNHAGYWKSSNLVAWSWFNTVPDSAFMSCAVSPSGDRLYLTGVNNFSQAAFWYTDDLNTFYPGLSYPAFDIAPHCVCRNGSLLYGLVHPTGVMAIMNYDIATEEDVYMGSLNAKTIQGIAPRNGGLVVAAGKYLVQYSYDAQGGSYAGTYATPGPGGEIDPCQAAGNYPPGGDVGNCDYAGRVAYCGSDICADYNCDTHRERTYNGIGAPDQVNEALSRWEMGPFRFPIYCPDGEVTYRPTFIGLDENGAPMPPNADAGLGKKTTLNCRETLQKAAYQRPRLKADSSYAGAADFITEYYVSSLSLTVAAEAVGEIATELPLKNVVTQIPDAIVPEKVTLSIQGYTGTKIEVYSMDWPYSVMLQDIEYLNGVVQTVGTPYEEVA